MLHEMDRLDRTLDELRAVVTHSDAQAPTISEWSVGMHVQHCCLAMIGVCNVLHKTQPPPPRSRPSIRKSIAFRLNRLPRRGAKSPERILPRSDVSQAELTALLDESARQLAAARTLDRGTWFKHFIFGVLTRDDALKFLQIHNRHHVRIVSDILKSGR